MSPDLLLTKGRESEGEKSMKNYVIKPPNRNKKIKTSVHGTEKKTSKNVLNQATISPGTGSFSRTVRKEKTWHSESLDTRGQCEMPAEGLRKLGHALSQEGGKKHAD